MDEDAHIIFGYVSLEEPCDEVKVTVIATGFAGECQQPQTGAARAAAQSQTSRQRPSFYAGRQSSPAERVSRVPHQVSAPALMSGGRSSDAPEQVQIQTGRTSGIRASMTSENDLDIPAFIRRQSE